MLRITIQDDPKAVTMRLEGKVVGPWVDELNRSWHALMPTLASKRFCIDLRDVAFVDDQGKRLLHEMYRGTTADFLADSPLTRYFAEEARQMPPKVEEVTKVKKGV